MLHPSPSAGQPSAPTDPTIIKYVGVTSDYATYHTNYPGSESYTTISFGIDGFGDFTSPVFYDIADREIVIDANQDGVDDYRIVLYSLGVGVYGFSQEAADNLYLPVVFDLNNSTANFSNYWTNGIDPQEADTNTFNNSALVVSVDAFQINVAQGGSTAFNYRVESYDRNSNLVSVTPELTYDLANPGLEGEN